VTETFPHVKTFRSALGQGGGHAVDDADAHMTVAIGPVLSAGSSAQSISSRRSLPLSAKEYRIVAEAPTEHDGHVHVSAPQEREQALELVALLLGHATSANGGAEELWRHAIAGGQRSVALRRLV